jgi:uncharacterized protein
VRFASEAHSDWSAARSPLLKATELLLEGARLFNEGKYWEAHEAWEAVWRELEGPPRIYLQGLIQASAAFHLLGIGRRDPAQRQARAAVEKLSSVEAPDLGFEIPGLLEKLKAWPRE